MKFENKMVLIFIGWILLIVLAVNLILNKVDTAGGVKVIAVSAGKLIKDVTVEIDAYTPEETSNGN